MKPALLHASSRLLPCLIAAPLLAQEAFESVRARAAGAGEPARSDQDTATILVRAYEVHDLVDPLGMRLFTDPALVKLLGLGYAGELRLRYSVVPPVPGTGAADDSAEQQRMLDRARAQDELAGFVRAFMEPPLGGQQSELRVVAPGTMLLNAPEKSHAWLAKFLEAQRAQREREAAGGSSVMADIEVTLMEAPKGGFDELGLAAQGQVALDGARAEQMKAGMIGRGDLIAAPRLMILPLQTATMDAGEKLAYVKSWKLERVQPGNQEIADPEVATVFEGFRITVAWADLGGGEAGLDLALSRTSVAQPIPTRRVPLGDSKGTLVEIAEPALTNLDVRARLVIAIEAPAAGAGADAVSTSPAPGVLIRAPSRSENRDAAVLVRFSETRTSKGLRPGKYELGK